MNHVFGTILNLPMLEYLSEPTSAQLMRSDTGVIPATSSTHALAIEQSIDSQFLFNDNPASFDTFLASLPHSTSNIGIAHLPTPNLLDISGPLQVDSTGGTDVGGADWEMTLAREMPNGMTQMDIIAFMDQTKQFI